MEELDTILSEFEIGLNKLDKQNQDKAYSECQYNMYFPKIRDYFIPYVKEQIKLAKYEDNIKRYFEQIINREFLVNVSLYYVENNKPKGAKKNSKYRKRSSIDEFLSALNSLYKIVLNDKYTNPTLYYCMAFSETIKDEIASRAEEKGIILLDAEKYPAIQTKQYEFIINKYRKIDRMTNYVRQQWLIIFLFLIYGVSFAYISDLTVSAFDIERRTLTIQDKKNKNSTKLDLPYNLYHMLLEHIEENDLMDNVNHYLFFANENRLQNHYYNEIFKNIKKEYKKLYPQEEYILNRFSSYGLSKYAIRNMIESGMDLLRIVSLTGRSINFVLDCQSQTEREHYVNMYLRGCKTFIDMT